MLRYQRFAFSPNGVLIASASGSRIEIIDLQSGEVTLLGQVGQTTISCLFTGWQESRRGEHRLTLRDTRLEFADRRHASAERRVERSGVDLVFA